MRLLFVVILIAAVACASPGSVANHSTRPVTQAQLYAWTYEGVVRQNSIDNRVVALPDGGYRQVFSRFRSFALNSEGLPGKEAYAVTATSKDGLHWTDEGESPIGYYVPVRLADGSYRAYAGGELYMSTDAKNWTLVGTRRPSRGHSTMSRDERWVQRHPGAARRYFARLLQLRGRQVFQHPHNGRPQRDVEGWPGLAEGSGGADQPARGPRDPTRFRREGKRTWRS